MTHIKIILPSLSKKHFGKPPLITSKRSKRVSTNLFQFIQLKSFQPYRFDQEIPDLTNQIVILVWLFFPGFQQYILEGLRQMPWFFESDDTVFHLLKCTWWNAFIHKSLTMGIIIDTMLPLLDFQAKDLYRSLTHTVFLTRSLSYSHCYGLHLAVETLSLRIPIMYC